MICQSPGNVTLSVSGSQITSGNQIGDKDYDEDFGGDLW